MDSPTYNTLGNTTMGSPTPNDGTWIMVGTYSETMLRIEFEPN